eukprot:9471453-Pyramimonas_sp.AAC.1
MMLLLMMIADGAMVHPTARNTTRGKSLGLRVGRHHLLAIGTTMKDMVDTFRAADDELDGALGE